MIPSPEQVRVAAYHRWQRRGGAHGLDWSDWFAAEQELLFAGNYEVLASYRLDEDPPRFLGDAADPVCRFCEQAAPRASFTGAALALPECLGNASLWTFEECDECRAQFREGFEDDLETFCRAARSGPAVLTIAAYKGLVRAALALLPRSELAGCEDTIEWISNPDHDLDGDALGDLTCTVFRTPTPSPWAALARRVEDDAPMPYLLFFAGAGGAVFQIDVPLCGRDEDLDGRERIVPRIAALPGFGREVPEGRRVVLPVAGSGRRRAMSLVGALSCGGAR